MRDRKHSIIFQSNLSPLVSLWLESPSEIFLQWHSFSPIPKSSPWMLCSQSIFLRPWPLLTTLSPQLCETERGECTFPSWDKALAKSLPQERRSRDIFHNNYSFSPPTRAMRRSFLDLHHENLVCFSVVKPVKGCPPTPKTAAFRSFSLSG